MLLVILKVKKLLKGFAKMNFKKQIKNSLGLKKKKKKEKKAIRKIRKWNWARWKQNENKMNKIKKWKSKTNNIKRKQAKSKI